MICRVALHGPEPEYEGHDTCHRGHRPVEDNLSEGNTLAAHEEKVGYPARDQHDHREAEQVAESPF